MLKKLLSLLPDVKHSAHPVENGSMTLEEFHDKMKEIYGSEREIDFNALENS